MPSEFTAIAWLNASGDYHTLLLGRGCFLRVGRLALRRDRASELMPRRLSRARTNRQRREGSKAPRHCATERYRDFLANQVCAGEHAPVRAARVCDANVLGAAAPQNVCSTTLRHRTEILDMKPAVVAEACRRVAPHIFPALRTRCFDFGWLSHIGMLRHLIRLQESGGIFRLGGHALDPKLPRFLRASRNSRTSPQDLPSSTLAKRSFEDKSGAFPSATWKRGGQRRGERSDWDASLRGDSYRVVITNTANPPVELKNAIVNESEATFNDLAPGPVKITVTARNSKGGESAPSAPVSGTVP
jgi:hypothetical protein